MVSEDTGSGEGIPERAGSRAELIHRDIVRAILEQRLGPGTKLGEDEVGQIYGVSRTIVRAALQTLAHDGIVVIEKNRGAFVAHPSVKEAREIFQARRLIEPVITELAVAACDDEAAGQLRDHLALEKQAQRDGDEPSAIRLSGEFHLVLAQIAGNDVYADFLAELVTRSSLIILIYRRTRAQCCKVDHHAALVAAITEGRTADAVAQMTAHLDEIEADLELVDTALPIRPLADVLGGAGRRRDVAG